MAERLIVVDKERLEYEGLFEAKALYAMMTDWARDKGYILVEKKHTESVMPEGKYVDIDFEPFKKFTDYAKSIIKMRLTMQNVKDVVVEKDAVKRKFQQGKISIVFDGILETDYEHRWETKPVFYFLRVIFEKYVYTPFISGFERGIKDDLAHLKTNIKAFLNLYKF